MKSSQEYILAFQEICISYYQSCQDFEPIVKYQHLLTMVDSCESKADIVSLNLLRNDLELPLPSTAEYSELIDLYQMIGFDASGIMHYPSDYPTYLQIKNECRNQVHEKGQKNRLDRLYTTLQTGYKSKLNSKERQERLEFFLTAFHSKTGAGPFIVAIEELLYRQSRSTQYVEWRVESFQFVETGIKDFDATAIELLQNLHCEFKLDEHCITWKCHLDRLECLYLELLIFAYARPIRAKVRAAGTFSFQTVRSIPEKTDFQSYLLWIKGYIQSSVLRSIYS